MKLEAIMNVKFINTQRGTEFVFNNKFSKYRISSDDRRLTTFLRLKYSLIKKLRLSKLYNHNNWYQMMDYYWKDLSLDETDFQSSELNDDFKLSKEDLQLKKIIIYDLLPKEYISDYKEKYLKFQAVYAQKSVFNTPIYQLKNYFAQMENSSVINSWFNLDTFFIKENTDLGEYFSSFSLAAIGLTESYYILMYELSVTEKISDFYAFMLDNKIYKSPICISNGKWWKKKSFAGCYEYACFRRSKAFVLDDYILELKSVFWNQVETKLFSKVFSWKLIPPSVEIYSSRTLDKDKEAILSLLSNNGNAIEKNSENSIYFLYTSNYDISQSLHNFKIVANSKEFEEDKKGYFPPYLYIKHLVCRNLADYFILEALDTKISTSIYSAQLQINKVVESKRKLKSYLKIKFGIDKKLYFYKRLYKELFSQIKSKTETNDMIKEYEKVFSNVNDEKYFNQVALLGFSVKYTSLYYSLKEKYSLLMGIYNHFEENSKIVQNKYNFNLVKWTFWISFLSLIATILFADDSFILKAIWEWIICFFK